MFRLYKNGVLDNASTGGAGLILNSHSNYTAKIGDWGAATNQTFDFNGRIDETQLYNRALSASEIAAIYNAGSAGVCAANVASTSAGSNVISAPTINVNLTFSSVSAAGNTVLTPLTTSQLPALPPGFTIPANAPIFDLRTSAAYSGNITVNTTVSNVVDSFTCSRLRLLHFESAA